MQPRFNVVLFSGFAMLGLAFAAAGIYSVISDHANRRTQEIGIRMALGAERGHVIILMLNMGAKLVAIGLLIGIVCSLVLARVLRSQIFHLPANRSDFGIRSHSCTESGGARSLLFACATCRANRSDPRSQT